MNALKSCICIDTDTTWIDRGHVLESRAEVFDGQDNTSHREDRVKYGSKSGSVNVDDRGSKVVMVTDFHPRSLFCEKAILIMSVKKK